MPVVPLTVAVQEVREVTAALGNNMPVVFLHLSPAACQDVRERLRMRREDGAWLDCDDEGNEREGGKEEEEEDGKQFCHLLW